MIKNKGFTDKEKTGTSEDMFDIGDYVDGLSQYIMQCPTPMTISIQGDWGSGKTSFMNMVKEELTGKVHTVWLNTWQFSQFNLGDSLPIMLLTQLANILGGKGRDEKDIKKAIKILTMGSIRILASGLTSISGIDVKGAAEKIFEDLPSESLTETVTKLKDYFQKSIDECIKEQDKNRVLIFVDDLDRIHPIKAVELLEVLKIFLDCDNCVFILAIDYEVVVKGINQKYGGILGEEKGRNFFDKMIQVPFKMPVAQYNIDNFVQSVLEDMNIRIQDYKPYVSLIGTSVGYNPRSMKRLFNSFSLLRIINKVEEIEKEDSELYELTLFAVLSLQVSFEPIYNFIAENIEEVSQKDFFEEISDLEKVENYLQALQENQGSVPSWIKEIEDIKDENKRYRICSFMEEFTMNITNSGEKFNEDCFERLLKAFDLASVTSVSDTAEIKTGKGKGTRYKYTMDKEFKFYSIQEPIEDGNDENGWNKAEINSFKLFSRTETTRNFAGTLVRVLELLYNENPEAFKKMREDAIKDLEDKGFRNLFVGAKKDGFAAPNEIPGTNITIETKTNNNQKVILMRKVLKAMGYGQSELELELKLARRYKMLI